MTRLIHRMADIALPALLATLLCLVAACQKTIPAGPELPDLNIGVIGVTQPMGITDLLAGFIPEDRVLASPKAVTEFNETLLKKLRTETKRTYTFIPEAMGADPSQARTAGHNGALAYWTSVGKKMKVDILIIPQIFDWHERVGGTAGVTSSAEVNMDFYLVDVRGEEGVLISRSHFQEKQISLSDNLINFDVFFKRGGKWITAGELALEGVDKMIREFGL